MRFATSPCYPKLQLLKVKLLKTLPKQAAEGAAAATAANWMCLIWLLQNTPEEVAAGLKADWQKHQAQEFASWVRPAAELNAVRSKTAAKVASSFLLLLPYILLQA